MAFKIATNTASLNTQKWLGVSGAGMTKSLERLSSGYKINKAADDAAGIAIALKLNVKAVSISKSIDNGNQAIAMLQTAEGGVETIANILTRLKELATEASSDNNKTDRANLDSERQKLETEIGKISENTMYGGTALLNGTRAVQAAGLGADILLANGFGVAGATAQNSFAVSGAANGSYTVATAAGTVSDVAITITNTDTGAAQTVEVDTPATGGSATVNFSAMGISLTVNDALSAGSIAGVGEGDFTVAGNSTSFEFQLGDTTLSGNNQVSVTLASFSLASLQLSGLGTWTNDDAGKTAAQGYLDALNAAGKAIDYVNTKRADIGAAQNQITYHIANMQSTYENTKAAESTIKDADFAAEMADFTKGQVLQQSGIAMLAQTNQMPQMILSLLN